MQASEIIKLARVTIHDIDGDRYSDSLLIELLDISVQQLRADRPDAFLGDYTHQTITEDSDLSKLSRFKNRLVKNVVAECELLNNDEASLARASAMMKVAEVSQ